MNSSAQPQRSKTRGRQSFNPEQRIKTQGSFQKVFNQGSFVKGRTVNVWVLFGSEAQSPRIGIVVSKKTHKKAVARNLWKRRIREAFRRNQAVIKAGAEVLVQSKKRDSLAPAYKEIETELMELLSKMNAVKHG